MAEHYNKTEQLAKIIRNSHVPLELYRLIAEGADINGIIDGEPLLITAISRYPDSPAALALLGAGADIEVKDEEEITPLMHALHGGPDVLPISLLILSFSSIGYKCDNLGRTPIWYAAPWAAPYLLSKLKEKNIPIDTFDDDGRSPLMYAAANANVDAVKWFLNNGASIHTADLKGNTPLMLVASYALDPELKLYSWNNPCAQVETVDLLLSAGSHVHSVNADGMTALMFAAQSDAVESARILLKAGSSLHQRNAEGDSALDISKSFRNKHMTSYLTSML